MGWRLLYIDESDNISLYLDNIKVKRGINEFTFPLNDIAIVLIDNLKITLSTGIISGCSHRNIPIVVCGENHHPISLSLPISGHFESSKIALEQIKWPQEYKNTLWKYIVKQKIRNQLFVLKRIKPEAIEAALKLDEYIVDVQNCDVTNREGLAAKIYFRSLFGDSFLRHDDDVINACLDYGYSIFRAIIAKTIVAKGLLPQLGVFHHGPTNAFNLVDDLIEIFRPIIDLFVYENFLKDKIFNRDIRLKILTILGGKIILNGQKATIYHAVEKLVDSVIAFFKNGEWRETFVFEPILYDL